jgi:hypothetical protein
MKNLKGLALGLLIAVLVVAMQGCVSNPTGVVVPPTTVTVVDTVVDTVIQSPVNNQPASTQQDLFPSTTTTQPTTNVPSGSGPSITIDYSDVVLPHLVLADNYIESPDPGDSYVIFNITATNNGYTNGVEINPYFFSAVFAQVEYTATPAAVPDSLNDVHILNGGTTSGLVEFTVPTNAASQIGSISFGSILTGALNIKWVNKGTTVSPTLVAIDVKPDNEITLALGGTQQLTATGKYWDGSTLDLTSQVTWVSDTPSVITVSSSGLATCVANGDGANITAALNNITSTPVLIWGPNF